MAQTDHDKRIDYIELPVDDVGVAKTFYRTVFGWKFTDYGPDYSVEASTDLVTWTPLFTSNAPALPFLWSDTYTNAFSQRFYRVRLGP